MNTNRISNKNLKRIAIAAGTTAAALFLSAGLVACDGQAGDKVVTPAQVANVADVLQNLAAEAIPATDEIAATEAQPAPVVETKVESTTQTTKKVAKATKKKPASTTQDTAPAAPTVAEPSPTQDVAVAPAPATSETSVVSVPAEQPAVDQPSADQGATAAQQPAASTTASNTSSWSNIPKITGTPSLASNLSGTDLTKLTSPVTLPKLCIPGVTC
jgi:outer membrane biosynthesis protein TonB